MPKITRLISSGSRIQTRGILVPESPRLSTGDVWETLNPPHTIIAAPFFPLGPISVVSRAYNLLKGLPSISDWKTKYVSSELLNAKCKIKF